MTHTKFAVYPLNNLPAGFPSKFGLLEVPDGPRRYKYTVFFTKKTWPEAARLAALNLAEQQRCEPDVLASDLPESISWLDGLVKQSRDLASPEHVM